VLPISSANPIYRCRNLSSQSKRPRRAQIYGYVLTINWIKLFAARKQIGSPDHLIDMCSSVVTHILRESNLARAYAVEWENDVALCIGIAHNRNPGGCSSLLVKGLTGSSEPWRRMRNHPGITRCESCGMVLLEFDYYDGNCQIYAEAARQVWQRRSSKRTPDSF
jgi:hypothetical protein